MLADESGQVVTGSGCVTFIQFSGDSSDLLTAEESAPPAGTMPENDILATPFARDPQEIFDEAVAEQDAGRRAIEQLPGRINARRSMGLRAMAGYTGAMFSLPFLIEGGILVAGAQGYGKSVTGLYLAGGELSQAVSTYAAGSTAATVGVTAAEAFVVADSMAQEFRLNSLRPPRRPVLLRSPFPLSPSLPIS
ncbi:hypothetical protein [Nannocystis pusilla]|uniref:hypothetical protein n=1 Tax=Nannocystis pusilla TaxID=889268 RepID=UPI003B795748